MPETVPRWLLAGAGIVALITILVGVKDFAERKSSVNPASSTSNQTIVVPDGKNSPKTTVKRKGTGGSAKAAHESASETLPMGASGRLPIMGGIVQAGERAPFVADNAVQKGQLEPVENTKKVGPARCAPLPNSTKPEDVDAHYYQNWAKEYGCGGD